jgi:tetratricopeptide (TPR) repeat protein
MPVAILVAILLFSSGLANAQTEDLSLEPEAVSGDSTRTEELPLELQAAVEAMEIGDYAAAAAELQGIVVQDSTNLPALRLLASTFTQLEAYVQAVHICRQIAKIDSTGAGGVAMLGFLYQKQGDYDLAEMYYLQAIGKDPNLVQAYQGLGWIYLQNRKLQQAFEMVTQTTERAPDYAPNYVLMGRVLTAQGFFENAKREYKRAFALDSRLRARYGILLQELSLRHRLTR